MDQIPTCASASKPCFRPLRACTASAIVRDDEGAVLIEAAIALPVMMILLFGLITYACWFMAAHSVQEAADEAARAALSGLSQAERDSLAAQALARSTAGNSTLWPGLVTLRTTLQGNYYSVVVTYDVAHSPLFQTMLVPAPTSTIVRSAVVQLVNV